jgi:GH15 family glucan-1,4-alpha-glucosidase
MIEDYAIIGDTHTAALIHRDGSIDWLCLPRFDSPAVFAAMLGNSNNGRWLLSAGQPVIAHRRRYRGDTLMLETEITTPTGKVRVTDFMLPRDHQHPTLIRIVEGLRGHVRMLADIRFRWNYGEVAPWVRTIDGALVAVSGSDRLVLQTPVTLHGHDFTTISTFDVQDGERIPFVLTWGPSQDPMPIAVDAETAFGETERYWSSWSAQLTYEGPYRDVVMRSLLTLKALTYEPTGGIVAAPTTSLPEQIGGSRNWDYRYTWLRDASITLGALLHCGYVSEAAAWRAWLLRAAYGDAAKLQIMYGIGGERLMPEHELRWLAGYAASAPVRIGNAASSQLQLDVYGEVIMALEEAREAGLEHDGDVWALQTSLLGEVRRLWREPDQGIWEMRSEPRHFVSSKLLAWAAVDRMIRGIELYGLPGPIGTWRSLRDEIRADILDRGYDAVRNTFVQSYGSSKVDASLLEIPLMRFLPVDDPRVQGTIAAIERDLLDERGLLLRYRTDSTGPRALDGLPPGEGAFLACTFWLVDTYILAGRMTEARTLFERLLALSNDVGLFAEEYDSMRDRQTGNFPQAFTHVAVVHSGLLLSEGARSTSSVSRWLAPRRDTIQRPLAQ